MKEGEEMKLAVFNAHVNEACQQTGKSRQEILTLIHEAGITGLEMDIVDITDVSQLKEELKATDMQISSICGTYHFEKTGQADLQLVDVAEQLGVKKIMPVPGFFSEQISLEKARENCEVALNELVDYADKKGIKVSIEDYDSATSVVMDSKCMRWFGDRIKNLYYTFDSGNFLFSGEDELAAFDALQEKIIHFHAKDRALIKMAQADSKKTLDGKMMYATSVGAGVIQMEKLLKKLDSIGYTDWLTIEHFGAADQLEAMLDSARWLNTQER